MNVWVLRVFSRAIRKLSLPAGAAACLLALACLLLFNTPLIAEKTLIRQFRPFTFTLWPQDDGNHKLRLTAVSYRHSQAKLQQRVERTTRY